MQLGHGNNMVQKKILEKMSDRELEKYIEPNSSYVYDAIEIAFDILKKRGRAFSDKEINRVRKLIKEKRYEDDRIESLNKWDINQDNNEQNIKLYSQKSVWQFSIFFGIHAGALLLALNFFKISKKLVGVSVIFFGIIYSLGMLAVYKIGNIYFQDYYAIILIFMLAVGGAILQFFFWDKYLRETTYRKKEITNPLIICIIFYALLFILFVL